MAMQKFPLQIITTVLICCFTLAACLSIAPSPGENPDQLAHQICKNTTNYAFCEATVYSDPRAPSADRYVLAYIVFGNAYHNATNTRDYIDLLLKNSHTGAHRDPKLLHGLKKCGGYYEEAVQALLVALDDLDTESFDLLDEYAVEADKASQDCEATFDEGHSSPLSKNNQDLSALAEICVVVSKLYKVYY